MPTTGSKRSPESIAKFRRTMALKNKGKKRKYTKRFAGGGPKLAPDEISVSGAIILLRKAKRAMTMEELSEKDLYTLLALQELQGSI